MLKHHICWNKRLRCKKEKREDNCSFLPHRGISTAPSLCSLLQHWLYLQISPANPLFQCHLHLPFHKNICQGLIKTRTCCLSRPSLGYQRIRLGEPERSLEMGIGFWGWSCIQFQLLPALTDALPTNRQSLLVLPTTWLDNTSAAPLTPPHVAPQLPFCLPAFFGICSTAWVLRTYLSCFKRGL